MTDYLPCQRRLTDFAQIEQFIESIFPSQDPNAVVLANGAKGDDEIMMKARGMNAQERERKRKLDEEAKRDVMLMGIATISIMAFLGGLMVSRAANGRIVLAMLMTDSDFPCIPFRCSLRPCLAIGHKRLDTEAWPIKSPTDGRSGSEKDCKSCQRRALKCPARPQAPANIKSIIRSVYYCTAQSIMLAHLISLVRQLLNLIPKQRCIDSLLPRFWTARSVIAIVVSQALMSNCNFELLPIAAVVPKGC